MTGIIIEGKNIERFISAYASTGKKFKRLAEKGESFRLGPSGEEEVDGLLKRFKELAHSRYDAIKEESDGKYYIKFSVKK